MKQSINSVLTIEVPVPIALTILTFVLVLGTVVALLPSHDEKNVCKLPSNI